MEKVTVTSGGNIEIPRSVRQALEISDGTALTLEVRGQQIILSKGRDWRALRGVLGRDTMEDFAEFRREERELEDSRP